MDLAQIALLVSIGGLLIQYFGFVVKQNERISKLEVRSDLFWKALENRLADMLKSPSHLAKDVFLDKLKDNTITPEETATLRTMLLEEYNHHDVKSLAAALLISRLDTKITLANLKTRRKKWLRL